MGEARVKHCDFIKLKDVCGTSKNVHYSAFYKDIPNDLKAYAEKELNETVENKANGIQALRDFLKRENIPDVEDCTLLIVLRNCKYDVKKSKAKLKKFLQTRSFAFKRVAELDMNIVEKIFEQMFFGFLPYRDKHGRGIVFTQPKLDLDLCSVEDAMITALAAMVFFLELYPMLSLTGLVLIPDGKFTSMYLHYQILKTVVKYVPMWLDIPVRTARIELTNEQFLSRLLFNILRPLLSSKMRERICLHGSNLKTLQKQYHPDLLPEEFGGNLGPISVEFYNPEALQAVLSFIKRLKAECKP